MGQKAALGTLGGGVPGIQKLLDGPIDLRARNRPLQAGRWGDELDDLGSRQHGPRLPQPGRPRNAAVNVDNVDVDGRTPEEAHPSDRPAELQPSGGERPDAVSPARAEPRLIAVYDPQPDFRLVTRSELARTGPGDEAPGEQGCDGASHS
jgi:hypothetical protein